MKILFVLTQLEVGGAQVRVFQTASELRSQGHEVDVVFFYKKRECFENESKIILSSRKGMGALPEALLNMYKLMRQKRYDLLVTNTAPANIFGNSIAALAGIHKRIAYQTQPPQRLNAIYRRLDVLLGRSWVYQYNIANSVWTRECFDGYPSSYLDKMHIITDGIVPRVSDLSKSDARAALGLSDGDKIVLNVGRLSKQKGQEVLLNALKEVPSAKLIITGDGELRDYLKHLSKELELSDRVVFTGEVPGEQVAILFRAADVFAFSSRWETFGLAAVEAAASGLPIVASDLPVLKEVLTTSSNDSAAHFAKVDDASSFAAAINHVLDEEPWRRELIERSLSVAERHSMRQHVSNILEAAEAIH